MTRVAIVTDSASDLSVDEARAAGITVVPLIVSFGEESFRSGVELSIDEFYRRLVAPGAPFPTTAACSPAVFESTFRGLLADGADAVVCITVGGGLSSTVKAARLALDAFRGLPVHVVDSDTLAAGQKLLAFLAQAAAERGATAEEIVALVEGRKSDVVIYIALETLDNLRRSGRISAAQAAIGSILSVKPIFAVKDGVVDTADKPRTRARARARLLELLAADAVDEIAVMHTHAPNIEVFADELAQLTGLPRDRVTIGLIGSSVAPHVGPGAYGAALLLKPY